MTFDPQKHMTKLKGKDYLEAKWRLVWLRDEHPDAIIETQHIDLDLEKNHAIFRATVTIPGAGSATGYGSESSKDFGDFIEKAETKALARALAALGYGTQFTGDELAEGERIVDSPVQRQQRPAPAPTADTTVDRTHRVTVGQRSPGCGAAAARSRQGGRTAVGVDRSLARRGAPALAHPFVRMQKMVAGHAGILYNSGNKRSGRSGVDSTISDPV
jgi:hypothetical protein